jgi:glucose/arabinose dehydrogenase
MRAELPLTIRGSRLAFRRLFHGFWLCILVTACAGDPDGPRLDPPAISISAPAPASTFRGGDSVSYVGSAVDRDGRAIPEDQLTWWVDLHHGNHTHPFLPRTEGRAGKVFVPPLGHPDPDIFLRFHLEAASQDGLTDTVALDVQPARLTFALVTAPAGLTITLDGQPHGAPSLVTGVTGMERELGAPSPQTLGTTVYDFTGWSDAGAQVHQITTPAESTSFVATFTARATPNQPPMVGLTSPSAGATVTAGTVVTLAATATDPDGAIHRVRFYAGTDQVGEDTAAPWTVGWTPLSGGSTVLTAVATDNLGSSVTSAGVPVTVTVPANQVPVATITAPTQGATLTLNAATTIAATASDPDGSIVQVQFFDGATPVATDALAPYSVAWTPSSAGSHPLTARATDNQGLVGTSAIVTVTVSPPAGPDTEAPSVQLTSPADGTRDLTGTIVVAATASDNVGVTQVEFQVDGEPLATDNAPPWQASVVAGAYASGVHVVQVRDRDAAGNVSPWVTSRITTGGTVDLPSGFSRSTHVEGLGGVSTTMAWGPDGRLFICEQGGAVRVVKNGALLAAPFLTAPTAANGERGLLGIAFHPDFASNGYVYVYYTSSVGGVHNRISRYTASGDVAASGSEAIIADLPLLTSATDHNGGALHFGADRKLYVAVGDNGTPSFAPDLTRVFGKMLRFNDDGSIPADNPFVGSTTGLNQAIWARGLRNPFTFAFDLTNARMYINDVGQVRYEEINVGRAGANYGWPEVEGPEPPPPSASYDAPFYWYTHSVNSQLVTGYAVVGGAFYRPASMLFPAAWAGHYFFGDYVEGWINRLNPDNGQVYAFVRRVSGALTDVRVGPDGALYVLANLGPSWGVVRYAR